jgi:hypothetical protein
MLEWHCTEPWSSNSSQIRDGRSELRSLLQWLSSRFLGNYVLFARLNVFASLVRGMNFQIWNEKQGSWSWFRYWFVTWDFDVFTLVSSEMWYWCLVTNVWEELSASFFRVESSTHTGRLCVIVDEFFHSKWMESGFLIISVVIPTKWPEINVCNICIPQVVKRSI